MRDDDGMPVGTDGAHTLGRWLDDRAVTSPAKTAIDDRGVRIDYARLAERVRDLAERLRTAGYGPGDRIATVSGNTIDHVVAFFACVKAGIAFIPLSWRLVSTELAEVMARAYKDILLFVYDFSVDYVV
jgi:fatty-acyl-CoA synthase